MYVYLKETKTVHSSAFPALLLFNIGIVHHFDTVNHLDTVETGHMQTPSTCSRSQDFEKLGRGLGMRLYTHLDG